MYEYKKQDFDRKFPNIYRFFEQKKYPKMKSITFSLLTQQLVFEQIQPA